MRPTHHFNRELEILKEKNLYRSLTSVEGPAGCYINFQGRRLLNLSSNNYLGLANHPDLKQAAVGAVERWGTGSGGSRLLSGTQDHHVDLEKYVAKYHELEKALVFNSGYTANTGIIQALAPGFKHIFSDKLNHASIIDGVTSGRTPFTRYRHLDMGHLEELLKKSADPEKTLVITETLFSMDGDFIVLDDLLTLQDLYGFFLYLDEAHSVGGYPDLLKPLAGKGNEKLLVMGTFGKALGGFGAFAAGEKTCIDFLINKCRSFIFSTALPAAVTAAALAALEVLKREGWRVDRIHSHSRTLIKLLNERGFKTGNSSSHIIPVILGENQRALAVSRLLIENGVYALPVRPPAVPAGSARLRVSLNCDIPEDELKGIADQLEESAAQLKSSAESHEQ